MIQPFRPVPGSTVNIDVASSTANVLVSKNMGTVTVRIMNNGSATAWIDFGDSTITAALASSMPVAASGTEVVRFNNPSAAPVYVAAIAAASTGKIYFTVGDGI